MPTGSQSIHGAPKSPWIRHDRSAKKIIITQPDLGKFSPGRKIRAGQWGQCHSRENLQFVSLYQFFSCVSTTSYLFRVIYLFISKVSGRTFLIPVGYSTNPIPPPQVLRISSNPTYQTVPKIRALLEPPQSIHQLGRSFISFSPGLGILSRPGCCSCEPLHFQQLPKSWAYFSGSILEQNLFLKVCKRGGALNSFSLCFKWIFSMK